MKSENYPKLNSLTLTLDACLNGENIMAVTHSGLENIHAKLQIGTDDMLFLFFSHPWPNMKRLCSHEVNKEEYQEIVASRNTGSMPNLTTIEIFMWNFVTSHSKIQMPLAKRIVDALHFVRFLAIDEIEPLVPVNIAGLKNLRLQRFICTVQHLYMMTQSSVLTQLHKLDISPQFGYLRNSVYSAVSQFPLT